MQQKQENSIYTFTTFKQFPDLVHGISTRSFGSVRKFDDNDPDSNIYQNNFHNFLQELLIPFDSSVGMKQRHTNHVELINSAEKQIIQNTDGLLTNTNNIFLYVVTADCVPVIFYDRNKKIVGVAHAGYKGLVSGILTEMIAKFIKSGSNKPDIFVGIGPCIGICCYNVNKERLSFFQDTYIDYFEERNGEYYLDLRKIAQQQLQLAGIKPEQIETLPICTKDAVDTFFSFRGDSPKTIGHFATIIGLKS